LDAVIVFGIANFALGTQKSFTEEPPFALSRTGLLAPTVKGRRPSTIALCSVSELMEVLQKVGLAKVTSEIPEIPLQMGAEAPAAVVVARVVNPKEVGEQEEVLEDRILLAMLTSQL
jgi:hypothetical protein